MTICSVFSSGTFIDLTAAALVMYDLKWVGTGPSSCYNIRVGFDPVMDVRRWLI